ncbi:hypothetical protein Mgra_00005311 [Meloidogyne graminicola]|uniref:Uncharacterized protein n=1 Tax=Meloidogyne graminicola TaxID=189291 RepID=A0A8S9ZNU0_9BILA|nr:hypothetical protein Mgra_00005311 [Meloidogyne graminicola]
MLDRKVILIIFLTSYVQTLVSQQIIQTNQGNNAIIKEFIDEIKKLKTEKFSYDDIHFHYGEFANGYRNIINMQNFSFEQRLINFSNLMNKYLNKNEINLLFTEENIKELIKLAKNSSLNEFKGCNDLFNILDKFIPKGNSHMELQFKMLVKQLQTEIIIGQSAIKFSELANDIKEVGIKYKIEIFKKMKEIENENISKFLEKTVGELNSFNIDKNILLLGSNEINKQISLLEKEMEILNSEEENLKKLDIKPHGQPRNSTIKIINSPLNKSKLQNSIQRILSINKRKKYEELNKEEELKNKKAYKEIKRLSDPDKTEELLGDKQKIEMAKDNLFGKESLNTYSIELNKNYIKNKLLKAKQFKLLSLSLEQFSYLNKAILAIYNKIVEIVKKALNIEELKTLKVDWEKLLDLDLKAKESVKDKKELNRIESWLTDRIEAKELYDIIKNIFNSIANYGLKNLNKFSVFNAYYKVLLEKISFPDGWVKEQKKIFDEKSERMAKFEALIQINSFRVILAYERLNKIFETFSYNINQNVDKMIGDEIKKKIEENVGDSPKQFEIYLNYRLNELNKNLKN